MAVPDAHSPTMTKLLLPFGGRSTCGASLALADPALRPLLGFFAANCVLVRNRIALKYYCRMLVRAKRFQLGKPIIDLQLGA